METRDSFIGRLMGQAYERNFKTDNFVEIPPALLITDERGDTWSLGTEYTEHGQKYNWTVIRNDKDSGEQAERIVMRNGKIKIFGWYGWKTWTGRTFV